MLKHLISLVFLFFSLSYLPALSDINLKLLPKPKPTILSVKNEKKTSVILPKKKPDIKINKTSVKKQLLPKEKPQVSNNKKKLAEKEIKNIEIPIKSKENEKINLSKKEKIISKTINNEFILPAKKPVTYQKKITKVAESSNILSKKDYDYAKQIFDNITQKKWSTAFALTKRVKNKDFRNLVTWIYLKEKTNKSSFDEYINFIDKNPNYPRINRLKYLAEHKINLKTTSPNTVIGWFVSNPPLSGFGKIKLGEAFILKGNISEGSELIKEGWITASLSSKDLRYLNKKYKKI